MPSKEIIASLVFTIIHHTRIHFHHYKLPLPPSFHSFTQGSFFCGLISSLPSSFFCSLMSSFSSSLPSHPPFSSLQVDTLYSFSSLLRLSSVYLILAHVFSCLEHSLLSLSTQTPLPSLQLTSPPSNQFLFHTLPLCSSFTSLSSAMHSLLFLSVLVPFFIPTSLLRSHYSLCFSIPASH